MKNTKISVLILFLCTIFLGGYIVWSPSYFTALKNLDYLAFIVAIQGTMTTIAIALAAFKVVTAKDSSAVVEEIRKIANDNERQLLDMGIKLSAEQDEFIKRVDECVNELIVIIQERGENVYRIMQSKIDIGRDGDRKGVLDLIAYINEMDKEIVTLLHILMLSSANDPAQRLRGYQLLLTTPSDTVMEFLKNRQLAENDQQNKRYLIERIISVRSK